MAQGKHGWPFLLTIVQNPASRGVSPLFFLSQQGAGAPTRCSIVVGKDLAAGFGRQILQGLEGDAGGNKAHRAIRHAEVRPAVVGAAEGGYAEVFIDLQRRPCRSQTIRWTLIVKRNSGI